MNSSKFCVQRRHEPSADANQIYAPLDPTEQTQQAQQNIQPTQRAERRHNADKTQIKEAQPSRTLSPASLVNLANRVAHAKVAGDLLVDLQWQHRHEDEIGDGQLHHVHVGDGFLVLPGQPE